MRALLSCAHTLSHHPSTTAPSAWSLAARHWLQPVCRASSTRTETSEDSTPSTSGTQEQELPKAAQGLFTTAQYMQQTLETYSASNSPAEEQYKRKARISPQDEKDDRARWRALTSQSLEINPCNSQHHPAVRAGVITVEGGKELSVQEAYTPKSQCFGCGPSNPDGLHLRSYRTMKNGLEARVFIPLKYCAFPGILNGGVLSTLLDCHGNWTAAIALMDKACLPKPPLTLTKSMFVTYKEPTPPERELLVQSQVVNLKQSQRPGQGKSSVEVQIQIFLQPTEEGEGPKLLVQGLGVFKRLGALRAL